MNLLTMTGTPDHAVIKLVMKFPLHLCTRLLVRFVPLWSAASLEDLRTFRTTKLLDCELNRIEFLLDAACYKMFQSGMGRNPKKCSAFMMTL